jgi:ABC-type phosphate transport system substrate-binding protein
MTGPRLQQRTARQRARLRAVLFGVAVLSAVWLACFADSLARAAPRSGQDFLVIVHPANPAGELSTEFVAEVFLKKTTRWGNGESMRPVDLAPNATARRRFSESVLKRSVAAVRSYWQQRIFTGRDVPPPELDSDDAVVRYVTRYVGAIGYVAPSAKLGDAKVLAVRGR